MSKSLAQQESQRNYKKRLKEQHPEQYAAMRQADNARRRAASQEEKAARAASNREWRKNNPEKWNKYRKTQKDKGTLSKPTPEQSRIYQLRYRYKITLEEYEALYVSQSGLCAICELPPRQMESLVVDHDHRTGKVRGLLCKTCNRMLGQARDDTDVLRKAIRYLDDASSITTREGTNAAHS